MLRCLSEIFFYYSITEEKFFHPSIHPSIYYIYISLSTYIYIKRLFDKAIKGIYFSFPQFCLRKKIPVISFPFPMSVTKQMN